MILGAARSYLIASAAVVSFGLGMTGAEASSYTAIYTFPSNGGQPLYASSLVAKNGELYGISPLGGSNACQGGCGTLFKLTTQGVLSTIYSFPSEASSAASLLPLLGSYYVSDGHSLITISAGGMQKRDVMPLPAAGEGFSQLALYGSVLAGAAEEGGLATGGGKHGYGLLFSLSKAGTKGAYKSLYDFTGGADGGRPIGAPVNVNGTLYGVTEAGGQNNSGVFYSLSPTGTETALFSFDYGRNPNFATPPVYDGAGHFYGTVSVQGQPGAVGAMYSTDTAGNKTTLHSFSTSEGTPLIGLTYVNGMLYGGTDKLIYSVDTSGTFKILHKFASGDGQPSYVPLVAIGGHLFGAGKNGTASVVLKVTP